MIDAWLRPRRRRAGSSFTLAGRDAGGRGWGTAGRATDGADKAVVIVESELGTRLGSSNTVGSDLWRPDAR
jgi:hypothetical protein